MKTRKLIIYIVTPLCVISIISAFLFEFIIICAHSNFIINVSLAIFGSSLFAIIIAVFEYSSVKRDVMEQFYFELIEIHRIFAKLKNYQINSDGSDNLSEIISQYIEISKFKLRRMGDLYSKIHFVFHHSKNIKWIYCNLYLPTVENFNYIHEITFHFKLFIDGETFNKRVIYSFLTEIQKRFFIGRFEYVCGYLFYNIYNKIADDLDDKINIFRCIIYGKSKHDVIKKHHSPILSEYNEKFINFIK